MTISSSDPEREELGKALADRLGLPHEMVIRDDWRIEVTGGQPGNAVWVTMSVAKMITVEEYNELVIAAAQRTEKNLRNHT